MPKESSIFWCTNIYVYVNGGVMNNNCHTETDTNSEPLSLRRDRSCFLECSSTSWGLCTESLMKFCSIWITGIQVNVVRAEESIYCACWTRIKIGWCVCVCVRVFAHACLQILTRHHNSVPFPFIFHCKLDTEGGHFGLLIGNHAHDTALLLGLTRIDNCVYSSKELLCSGTTYTIKVLKWISK